MVSPASANNAALVFGNGLPVVGAPAFTEADRPARPCARGGLVVRIVAAVALELLAGHDLQPVRVAAAEHAVQAAAVRVEHADAERDVGRHFHLHRAVGLDRRVAEDLAHPSARFGPNAVLSMSRVSSSGCDTAFSMRRKRAGRVAYAALRRIAHGRDAAGRLVDAVDVVDAADVQHADAFGEQVRREVDAGGAIEDDRRQRARRAATTSVNMKPSCGTTTGCCVFSRTS